MSIPNVSTLYQKISKGAEGGLEFARIINQLLISESELQGYHFINYSDAAGDYKGVDGILNMPFTKAGLQYKFFPSSFSANHKSAIKEALKNAILKFPDMQEWILVTPEDPLQTDLIWLDNLSNELNMSVSIWGHERIINLMLKHTHIGKNYYPDLIANSVRLSSEPTQNDIDSYFNKFMDPDTDVNVLFLKAQPTLSDCKVIFTKDFYKEVSDIYYLQYRHLFDDAFDSYSLKTREIFRIKSNTYEEIISRNHALPGGMHTMLEKGNILNPKTRFYKVDFLEKGKDSGVSFSVWCYINSRWVFFPKPFRVLQSINAMRNDKGLKQITWFLKWFGLSKKMQKYKGQSILAVNHIVIDIFKKS